MPSFEQVAAAVAGVPFMSPEQGRVIHEHVTSTHARVMPHKKAKSLCHPNIIPSSPLTCPSARSGFPTVRSENFLNRLLRFCAGYRPRSPSGVRLSFSGKNYMLVLSLWCRTVCT